MSWRTIVITKRCKLESKLGYLVCRGEETRRIFISEISTLIIESTAASLTTALLSELIKNKVNIIFCDEKHNPQSQLISLFARYDGSGQIRKQIMWSQEAKSAVWTEIVRNKIYQQWSFLKELGFERADMLYKFANELVEGDITNREGHAAKVYFDTLFGLNFKRGDDTFTNSALNYGYAIILSAFNREIVSCGYLTQLGINHCNEFNSFNLSCDLMEPFRILIDRFVFSNTGAVLKPDYKIHIINILNSTLFIEGQNRTVIDAISIYCKCVFSALEKNNPELLRFYKINK
jgi:CRISPR-associated protein Cas1